MPMIDTDLSCVKCDGSISIVGRLPTDEEISKSITPHEVNKAVVVPIINSYEMIAGFASDSRDRVIREQGVRAIQCATMVGASLIYASLSDDLKNNYD